MADIKYSDMIDNKIRQDAKSIKGRKSPMNVIEMRVRERGMIDESSRGKKDAK